MNTDKLREQLKIDEGCIYEIYNDHLGYATFGIGHLVRESDPENGSPVGTKVTKIELPKPSMMISKQFCQTATILYPDFEDLPEEAQQIIANMMFNLGLSKTVQVSWYEGWS